MSLPDPHWAPPQIVLADRTLDHAGHLQVSWPRSDSDLVDGVIRPSAPLRAGGAVYALAEAGEVRYVGYAEGVTRMFGSRRLGRRCAKRADDPRHAEECRLRTLILSAAREGRTVDVYLLPDDAPAARAWWRRTRSDVNAMVEATVLGAEVAGTWQVEPRRAVVAA